MKLLVCNNNRETNIGGRIKTARYTIGYSKVIKKINYWSMTSM